jgi:hypothetical protein
MAQEPVNHTLKVLNEIRAEMRQGFAETRAEMRQGFAEARERFDGLEIAVAALSADLKTFRAEVSGSGKKSGRRFNTLEERIAALEEHTGLVKG